MKHPRLSLASISALLSLTVATSLAQSTGDYRSKASGNWNATSTWEVYSGGSWIAATGFPDSSSGVITIKSGHTVTITASVVYDQLVVEAGAQVTVPASVPHTLGNGTGTDLQINGTWLNQGGTWTINSSATWALNSGGTFIHNTSSGIATPLSSATISSTSTFEYRDSGTPSIAGKTYGSLSFTTLSTKTYTNSSGITALTVNGNFSIGSGVTWNTAGFTSDITVQGSTSISGTWTGGGTDAQGVHTFVGAFTINPGGTYSLATTGTQGDIHFKGNLTNNGTFTTPSNRNILFDGTSAQTISGTSTTTFNNGFTASQALTIASGATLTMPATKTFTTTANVNVQSGGTLSGAGTFVSNNTGVTITNGGTISVATVLLNGGASPKYLAGAGTWSGSNLTIAAACSLELAASQTFSSCTITNHGSLEIYGYAFKMVGGSFTNASDGYVHGYYDSFETEGTVTITQNGSFNETLVIKTGTTTTSGTYSEPIIVKPNGTLAIPTGETLTVQDDVTVEQAPPSYGTITGPGSIAFEGWDDTFTNNGVVSAPTTFINVEGGQYYIAGIGTWGTVTVEPSVELELSSSTTISGGTINVMNYATIDVFGWTLTLDGVSVAIAGSGGQVIDDEGGGEVVTKGTTAIDQGGSFSVPLQVSTGTTTIRGIFNDIQISNPGNVALNGATTVNGTLNVLGGNLTTGANTLTLGGTATITETAPYSVVGKLTTTRTCAIGPETFGGIGVQINAAAGPPGSTAITRYTGTAPTFPPGTPIKRYFDILPATNSGLNAAFAFYYQDAELNGNTESGLLLYMSTDGGSTWTSQGGLVNTGSNVITLSGVNQFSRWTAGGLGNPAPTLATITPTAVELGATRDIVLTGTGFVSGVSTPDFGSDVTLNSLTVNSSTQMTANITVSPTGAIGARSISVTNSSPGGGTATLTNALTVVYPPPTLGNITPNTASRGQTMNIVLTGDGYYAGITSVNFGANVTVNSVTVASTTQLTANITVGASASTGLRSITVNNAGPGGGSTTWQNAFTINNPAPTLTSVSPVNGNRNQTLSVVVRGSNFLPGISAVSFGPDITVNSTTADSSTQITASISISASAATGSRNVTITNPAPGGGTATLTDAFTIGNPAPSLTNVSPNTAARGETMSVTLTGSDFIDGVSSANFGAGITLNSTTVNSATQMTVNITIALDAALELRDISVTNAAPGGGTATMSSAFNVINPAPTLASIAPTSGSRGQTLNVTLTGTNFIPGVTSFAYGSGITVNSVSAFNSTQVTASVTIDIGTTPGSRDITATNAAPGGGSVTLTGAFTVTNPLPTLTGVSPNRAGRGSKINVVLTGTNFLAEVSSVSFGPDITVNSTTISSVTQMLVNISVSSSASTGARNVSVTNATPGGGTATLTGGFTVDTSPATSVENTLSAIPEDYALHEAYPNPFNPSTKIRYGLPERSRVKLEVYNMLGNVVADLVSGERSKGFYEVEWIADNLPSGVYLVRLFSESVETNKRFIASRKVVLVK